MIKDEDNNDAPQIEGDVVEALPNAMFRVSVNGENEHLVLAYLSGRMRRNRIRVMVGDKVRVETDQYGERGRITRRL